MRVTVSLTDGTTDGYEDALGASVTDEGNLWVVNTDDEIEMDYEPDDWKKCVIEKVDA